MRFAGPDAALAQIRRAKIGTVRLMEVCGTHTMSIAKNGIRSLLPDNIELLSGPGCPVCVTPGGVLDAALELAVRPDVILTSYGDMLRVPGSRPGDDLSRRRAAGARVEVVYSPMDALEIAAVEPEKEVVFLGVGFETTAPGTAITILQAEKRGLRNFSVLSMLKTVEPALRALIAQPDFSVDGFLCPGHVAAVTGAEAFRFLPETFGLPAVVSGFEGEDILEAVAMLTDQLERGAPDLENQYGRVVSPAGNRRAMAVLDQVFTPRDDDWRGLGRIEKSGLGIRPAYAAFDAERKFSLVFSEKPEPPGCRCGDIICGRARPASCPLFGTVCMPEDPVGPCMVSGEGACAAAWKYGDGSDG